ncbi:MAG: stage II sporulation protein P [Firmicutes bacterium]|nr:stage II sporulation protein P [Bacillota bacterium]
MKIGDVAIIIIIIYIIVNFNPTPEKDAVVEQIKQEFTEIIPDEILSIVGNASKINLELSYKENEGDKNPINSDDPLYGINDEILASARDISSNVTVTKITNWDGTEGEITTRSEQENLPSIPIAPAAEGVTRLGILGIKDNLDLLKRYVYIVDAEVSVSISDFPIDKMLSYNCKTDLSGDDYKILIIHTHSHETFSNSRPGELADSIVGVGKMLTNILKTNYKVSVLHIENVYVPPGEFYSSYEYSEEVIREALAMYPSIEIVIDMHRDGTPSKFMTMFDDRPTARIMFFNGLSKGGLYNPYVFENTAFSLQLFLEANEKYPGLMRPIYLHKHRYSTFQRAKSILVEVGSDKNSIGEATNAMVPLADVLYTVLTK